METGLCKGAGLVRNGSPNRDRRTDRRNSRLLCNRERLPGRWRRGLGQHNLVGGCTNCFPGAPARLYRPRRKKSQRHSPKHRYLIMQTDLLLLRQTRRHFPRFNLDEIKIVPIEKGGSDRRFYRVRCSSEQSLILVKYNLEREENRHYVAIAQFLEAHGIRAPRIYYHDPNEGLIWLEDLGENDLFSYRGEPWLVRRTLYQSALDEIAKLHRLPESACIEMRQHLPAEFN